MANKHFLSKIANQLQSLPADGTLVILPTQRAASELRIQVASNKGKAGILPTIIGISDFNERTGALPVVSKEKLLLELYDVYRRHDEKENLRSFLGWAEQMLKDFNEIDLQLIFANDLFKRIADIKEIEMEFSPEDDRQNFMNFWEDLSTKNISPLQEQFLSYWEKLPFVYHDFRNQLLKKGFAYEGLSLRLAAESTQLPDWLSRFTHVLYAGFYALNRVEEKFLEKIGKNASLQVLKDADEWYSLHPQREAGMFFRKGYMSKPDLDWSVNELIENQRSFTITGVTGGSAMARELTASLSRQLANEPDTATKTVVILPDENLLFSFLNFCQTQNIPVNPSMGYPVTQHVLWQVMETLKTVRTSFTDTGDPSVLLRKKEILLSNVYLSELANTQDASADEKSWPAVLQNALLKSGDSSSTESELLIDLLYTVLPLLKGFASQGASSFLNEVERTTTSLIEYNEIVDRESWWKLITDTLRPGRLPFKADREKGVHVMGFLETRVLDFPHVYIASMNEGTFPSPVSGTSLIPYAIRKYYGLPCREEQEAVTAFHFYRLLQRTEKVHLYYDNSPDAMGGGEKSRFLLQLYHELIPENNSQAEYLQISNPPTPAEKHPIIIQKSPEIIAALEDRYIHPEKAKAFSASAINTYISCKLKFYLEQIAGIRSKDDITKGLEANIFGSVLHKAMEILYHGKEEYSADDILHLLKGADEAVNKATEEVYRKGPLYGHDLLMQEVLKKLVKQILENDSKDAPFKIIGLEKEVAYELTFGNRTAKFKGVIDRIDVRGDIVRILDYKTGQEELKLNSKSPETVFTDPKKKVAFQLLLYMLLAGNYKENRKMMAGIFHLSRENEITFLPGDDSTLFAATNFEENLKQLVAEIFDPSVPFDQTQDYKRCTFCDFAGLCRRN